MTTKKKGKFRFLHIADSHNGYSGNASKHNEYSSLRVEKTVDNGINIRQDDIDRAFSQAMDIAIEEDVDAVIHAGDGWDAWGYKQRYIDNVYTREVTRLYKEDIDYIEIAGNHNLPGQRGKGCFLETLGRYPKVHTVYQGFYDTVELEKHDVVIHCAPSTFTQEILDESISEIAPIEGKVNIGVGHFGVTTIKHYAEHAEKTLVTNLDALINCKMDYFALGDYHVPTDFGHNIRYSGSIERLGFGEVHNKPQVLIVEIDKETKEVEVKPVFLDVRPMLDLPLVNAENKSAEEINQNIKDSLSSEDLSEAIVRLRVTQLPKHLKQSIDTDMVKDLTASSLYFKFDFKDKTEKGFETRTSHHTDFDGVIEGWEPFMKNVEADQSFNIDKVSKMGLDRLAAALEK